MALGVYDLAVDVVLYLVGFQRRVADGEPVSYDDTRAEVLKLLSGLDQRSHSEPGLWDAWTKARAPLVYLIDEVMILNCEWDHRQRWADECFEVALLGHPEALGGDRFYRECDEAIDEFETAERMNRQDVGLRAEILMVYYVALQTGFKGRYALDLDAWREYKSHLFAKLPAYSQTRTKELFPEADDHTVLMDPNYEPVMRLLYVFIAFVAILSLYMVSTGLYWNQMVREIREFASETPVATSQPSAAPAPADAAEPDNNGD